MQFHALVNYDLLLIKKMFFFLIIVVVGEAHINNNIVNFKIVHCFQPRQRIYFEVEDIHTVVPEYTFVIKCILFMHIKVHYYYYYYDFRIKF